VLRNSFIQAKDFTHEVSKYSEWVTIDQNCIGIPSRDCP